MTFGPPPPTFGPAAAQPEWFAPTPVEQRLYEAKARGHWAEYYEVLAGADLFFRAVPDETGELVPDLREDPRTGAPVLYGYTDGRSRTGATSRSLIARRASDPDFSGTVRALRIGGPLRGPVAHGLACGALMSVKNGHLWNALGFHGNGYETEREQLERWWGVTSRAEWQDTLRRLPARENLSPVWEFALGLRARAEGATVLTPDGVTRTAPRPEPEVRAHIAGVQHLIGRITRYEARMRADGILAEGRYVRSVDGWDLGRCAGMACWSHSIRHPGRMTVTREDAWAALSRHSSPSWGIGPPMAVGSPTSTPAR
jgi:hypothetical protein